MFLGKIMREVSDIKDLIIEFRNIKHDGNCLILANELRMRLSQRYFPDALMEKAHDLDSMDFRFAERLLNVYGNRKDGRIETFDIALLNFNKTICLATVIDDYFFYLGSDNKIASRPVEVLSRFIVGVWEVKKEFC
jgi:hypothetical protein